MRWAPTLTYVSFGLIVVACAADEGERDASKPSGGASNELAPVKPSDDGRRPSPSPPAAFDPRFTNPPPASPSSNDPTPANGDQCIDNDDPGGAENVATKLPDTDDCDDELKSFAGVAKGAVDVDFYKLSATDQGVSLSHPFGCKKDTDFEAETAGVELCVYARCKNSTTDAVTGCEAGSEATSEIGMKGCCAAAPGKAIPVWDCAGISDDDSADFFLRVRQVGGEKCLPYKVKYRF